VEEANTTLLLRALGQRIRELRTERGYSQEAFADKCGVHRTFMGTVERGESNLSFQNIVKVVTTLGISPSFLLMILRGALKFWRRNRWEERRSSRISVVLPIAPKEFP